VKSDARRALTDAATLLAVALWLGGWVVLGAVVAPTVFHRVPAPASADAMTLVFGRFERIALTCAAIAAVAEAARIAARADGPGSMRVAGLVRAATLTLASALALVEALVLSPAITALHRGGAIRGLGADGLRLDELHHWAERAGKGQVLLLVAYLAAFAIVHRPPRASVERAGRAPFDAGVDARAAEKSPVPSFDNSPERSNEAADPLDPPA
jgi:hypothetical protein